MKNMDLENIFGSTIEKDDFFSSPEKRTAYLKLKELFKFKINEVKTLEAFYNFVQEANEQIYIIYDKIECKSGCSRCCKFYSSPHIYRFEWEYMKNYIEKNFTEKEIKRVKRKFLESIEYYKEALENDLDNPSEISNPRIAIHYMNECPFLYKNMCSIYQARPIICRIFGLSSYSGKGNVKNYEKVLACIEERERWRNEYEETPEKSIALPSRDYFIDKLLELFGNDKNINTNTYTIQYYLTEYFNEY